jgi:NADH-quinone oxidoreductase subunit D
MFWYCFRERDRILDLFELVGGYRHAHALLPGRAAREDIPPGFFDECAKFVD